MLNNVVLMGRLVRDPELRRTPSGVSVASMRIAVERNFRNQDGSYTADFFDLIAWRNTAEFISRYFTKGRMIVVSGSLQTNSWTDRDGNKRSRVEVVVDSAYFGDSKRDGAQSGGGGSYGNSGGEYGDQNASAYGNYGNSGYGNYGNYGSAVDNGGYGAQSAGGAQYGGYGNYGSGGSAYGNYGNSGYGNYGTDYATSKVQTPSAQQNADMNIDPDTSEFTEMSGSADGSDDLPF